MRTRPLLLALVLLTLGCTPHSEATQERLRPIPFWEVELTDSFWSPRVERLRERTIPFALAHARPSIENLRRTAHFQEGIEDALPIGPPFLSSDLFKIMEGIAYSLHTHPNAELEAQMDTIIAWTARAQQPDGYLFEMHTCGVHQPKNIGESPYSHLSDSHELYNVGHLYEAAAAYYQATGKRNLLDIAEKSAQHVNRVFFEGDAAYNGGEPINRPPGHQEIEIGLCKLYEVTENPLYLEMAARFLDIRGHRTTGDTVYGLTHLQQHLPVREQFTPMGHAVRAGYMYAAMARVDGLQGEREYAPALDSLWGAITTTRISITGGVGPVRHRECFGEAYDLPNKRAYNETCAAIANLLFNEQLFLNYGDGRYGDIAEVILYNGMLSGINLEGDRFFYCNPLEADGMEPFNQGGTGRAQWFGCACCPPNLIRTISSIGGRLYAHTDRAIYLSLYADSRTTIPLAAGEVHLSQHTDYPYGGEILLSIDSLPQSELPFALHLRIPTWAQGEEFMPGGLYTYATPSSETHWSVQLNGEAVECEVERGFAVIERSWRAGDQVELHLPIAPHYVVAHDSIEANHDRTAIVRGPLLYCGEGGDNGLMQRYYLSALETPTESPRSDFTTRPLVGLTLPAQRLEVEGVDSLRLIPYYSWNNRGDSSMLVWLPRSPSTAALGLPTRMKVERWLGELRLTSNQTELAKRGLTDEFVPYRSHHGGLPYWTSEGAEGEAQRAEFIFTERLPLDRISLYWLEDDRRTTRRPTSWRAEYLLDGAWLPFPLYLTDDYRTMLNQYSVIHPQAELQCDGIRLLIEPQAEYSIGLAEVKIDFTAL